VWPDQVADGSLSNATPGKGGSGRAKVFKLSKVCLINFFMLCAFNNTFCNYASWPRNTEMDI
jgi:hypothetical protein